MYFYKPDVETFGSKLVAFYENEVCCSYNNIFGSECVSHSINKAV